MKANRVNTERGPHFLWVPTGVRGAGVGMHARPHMRVCVRACACERERVCVCMRGTRGGEVDNEAASWSRSRDSGRNCAIFCAPSCAVAHNAQNAAQSVHVNSHVCAGSRCAMAPVAANANRRCQRDAQATQSSDSPSQGRNQAPRVGQPEAVQVV